MTSFWLFLIYWFVTGALVWLVGTVFGSRPERAGVAYAVFVFVLVATFWPLPVLIFFVALFQFSRAYYRRAARRRRAI